MLGKIVIVSPASAAIPGRWKFDCGIIIVFQAFRVRALIIDRARWGELVEGAVHMVSIRVVFVFFRLNVIQEGSALVQFAVVATILLVLAAKCQSVLRFLAQIHRFCFIRGGTIPMVGFRVIAVG